MRHKVILSPYVKDLGKVVDTQEDEILCNASLKTARRIAACLEVCTTGEAAMAAHLYETSPDIVQP